MLNTLTITGRIIFKQSKLPIPDVKVELWDGKDTYGWLAASVTDKNGNYSFIINDPIARQISSGDIKPKYVIRRNGIIICRGTFLNFLQNKVDVEVPEIQYDKTLRDISNPNPLLNYITVSGVVTDERGATCNDRTVGIYESGFRTEKILASGKTGPKGDYKIIINTKSFTNTAVIAKRSIKVKITEDQQILGSSPDIYDWAHNIVADIRIDTYLGTAPTQPEYDRFVALINQLTDNVPLNEIEVNFENNVNEIQYLGEATGIGTETVKSIVNATKYALETGLPDDILYALVMSAGNNVGNPVLQLKGSKMFQIIENAVTANIIQEYSDDPQGSLPTITDLVDIAKQYQVEYSKNSLIKGESYTINDLLLAIFSTQQIAAPQNAVDTFLTAYLGEYSTVDDFWQDFSSIPENQIIASIAQKGLRVAAITNYQPSITRRILHDLGNGHISELATWTVDEWQTKIASECQTQPVALKVPAAIRGLETLPSNAAIHHAYARRLAAVTQAMYPLANITAFLSSPDGDTVIPDQDQREQVVLFVAQNPDFDIRRFSIFDINESEYNLENIELTTLQQNLQGIARLSKIVGGNPFAVIKLLQNNISSAKDIAQISWEDFRDTYGYLFSPQEGQNPPTGPCAAQDVPGLVPTATEVYQTATSVTAGLMAMLGGAMITAIDAYPAVLGDGTNINTVVNTDNLPIQDGGIAYPHSDSDPLTEPHISRVAAEVNYVNTAAGKFINASVGGSSYSTVITGDPTLAALFGSLDYAICSDCNSIYSPAAYLTDTLQYLRLNALTVYTALDARRPDIKNIMLNCDNTNTPVPYIDLVNELLEVKVMNMNSTSFAPPANLSFSTIRTVSLASVKIDQSINNAVANVQSINAASNLSVVKEVTIDRSPISPSVQIGSGNIQQNTISVQNNNVKVSVNKQQTANVGVSNTAKSAGLPVKGTIDRAGQVQAAFPERNYQDNTSGNAVSFYAATDTVAPTVPIYDRIYGKLIAEVYPRRLPFNMAIEEARAYMQHLGKNRYDIMQLFTPINQSTLGATTAPFTDRITDYALCAEYLKLTEKQASIVSGSHPNYASYTTLYTFYGAASASSGYPNPLIPGSTFTVTGGDPAKMWEDAMSGRVDILLQQTNITYNELLQYLTTDYLNPFLSGSTTVRNISILPLNSTVRNDTAKTSEMRLVFNTSTTAFTYTSCPISVAFYTKLHSFIRLVKTNILSIYHWDVLLQSLQITGSIMLDNTSFVQLVKAVMMAEKLGIEPEILAMWWNNVNTKRYINYPANSINELTSVYDDIFNNKAVVNNPQTTSFAIPTSLPSGTYTTWSKTLATIMGIKTEDFLAIATYLGLAGSPMSLLGLSRIYVYAQIAQASIFTINDFLTALKLSTIPVDGTTTVTTSSIATAMSNLQLVIDLIRSIKDSKFQISEINYLLAGTAVDNASAPPVADITTFLETVRKILAKNPTYITNYASSTPTPTAEQITNNDALYKKLQNIVYQNFSSEFGITVEEVKKINNTTSSGSLPDGIISKFFDDSFVKSTFNLSEKNITYIDTLTSGTTIANSPIDGNNGNKVPNIKIADLYKLYRYFHKIAFIYQRLGLREAEFAYLFTLPTATTYVGGIYTGTLLPNQLGFDFAKLPVYAVSSAPYMITGGSLATSVIQGQYSAFLRVNRMMDVINSLSLKDNALGAILDLHAGIVRADTSITLLTSPTTTDLTNSLVSFLGILRQDDWSTQVDELLGNTVPASGTTTFGSGGPGSILGVKFSVGSGVSDLKPDAYKNISTVLRAIEIVRNSISIELMPSALQKLTVEDVTNVNTRDLVQAISGQYTDDGWNAVAKPLRDQIRVQQRDALVAYTRKTGRELFAELLIDVDMDACMETTRIKQALSSIQLYVDRVVMGLEKSGTTILTLPISVLKQWQSWRKWYRIWEANRKIFFYPEDWMEPELRDDKTPFFTELETELKQDMLTDQSAERAISNYLQKLDEVGKLEPVGLCKQTTEDNLTITHIISRTYNSPRTYFHRKLINNIWGPWEKMKVQITGDHIVPFVWNNRLFIFWLTFVDKSLPFSKKMKSDFASYLTNTASGLPSGDKLEWFYNEDKEMGADPSANVVEGTINFYKALQITLNWSEFKDGEWRNNVAGEKTITLKCNPIIDYILNNSTNSDQRGIFQRLMKNTHTTVSDFIRSRLFLYPYVHGSAQICRISGSDDSYDLVSGDLYLMVMFPTENSFGSTGLVEYADHVKSFHFSGSTNVMDVPYRLNFHKRILPLKGTYFKNQSLVTPYAGVDLTQDTIGAQAYPVTFFNYDRSISDLLMHPYFAMGYTTFYSVGNRRDFAWMGSSYPVVTTSNRIITPTKSTFRIIPTAGYATSPGDEQYVFEDSDNIFFVSKETYATPDLVIYNSEGTALRDRGVMAAATMSQDELLSSAMGLLDPAVKYDYVTRDSSVSAVSFTANLSISTTTTYRFKTLYHHHVNVFMRMLNQYGIKGLLRPDLLNFTGAIPIVQAARDGSSAYGSVNDDSINFYAQYLQSTASALAPLPTTTAIPAYPTNRVDFDIDGAYSVYNWELFFHIPMMIAQRLSENLQFFDAQKWYHYVFDPTSITYLNNVGSGPQRFWKVFPFHKLAGSAPATLEQLLSDIRNNLGNAQAQVAASSEHPFDPYMLGRLRQISFMKMTIMKYLDNLIAWGDNLFMRDTLESINEATQIYMLASNILGNRPSGNIQRATTKPRTAKQLIDLTDPAERLDPIGEAAVAIETFIDPNKGIAGSTAPVMGRMNYFCLQPNNKLLTYWDTVEDRLFKIRHCQNISGVVRKLSIYDSPIDPGILTRAAASGTSIEQLLNDVNGVNGPHYRFTYMVQKANEFVNDVKALGSALLSALEKKDAEQLAILRQGQEINLQTAILNMKSRQVEEAKVSYDVLLKNQENANAKIDHYRTLLNNGLNDYENDYLKNISAIGSKYSKILSNNKTAQALSIIPTFSVQAAFAIGPSFGGSNLAAAANFFGAAIANEQQQMQNNTSAIAKKGENKRRAEDWEFQLKTAQVELQSLEKQIESAQIKIDIAVNDYQNQQLQIDNASKINDYMRFKYTNQELYDWMANQISTTYYRAFQVAYSMAKKALLCFRYELPDSAVAQKELIQPIYWDSRRKGLLAGELLQLDLRNMEVSYMEENKRMFELTKNISLAQLDPYQLEMLRTYGYCSMVIPEEWFDLDYPGHLNRTIKSVSISIPCVAGPNVTVPCTLSLASSSRRTKTYVTTGSAGSYSRVYADSSAANADDVPLSRCSMIATSSAQNDNGVFDFNFRDERYLPFEGAGAISSWNLSLYNSSSTNKPAYTSIDFDSITDVVLHMKYTATQPTTGFDTFIMHVKRMVADFMKANVGISASIGTRRFKPLSRMFSLKHEFPNEWFAYANAFATSSSSTMQFKLLPEQFPTVAKGATISIGYFYAVLRVKDAVLASAPTANYRLYFQKNASGTLTDVFSGSTTGYLAMNYNSTDIPYNATGTVNASSAYSLASHSLMLCMKDSTGATFVNINDIVDDIYLIPIYHI